MPMKILKERLLNTDDASEKLSRSFVLTGGFTFSQVPINVTTAAKPNRMPKMIATLRYILVFKVSLIISVGTSPARIAPTVDQIILRLENFERMS